MKTSAQFDEIPKRYQLGQLLKGSQIKDDAFEDYRTPRGSVMPADYCCNK